MINRTSVDRTVLSVALLPMVKEQARVRHGRDDTLITAHTSAAIGMAEKLCNVSLDPAEYVIAAPTAYPCMPPAYPSPRWLLPLNNVREFTVAESGDAGAADLSAGFELWQEEFGGNASAYLRPLDSAALPWGARLTLTVGVEDATKLAPAFVSLIARMAASMYENREATSELWATGFSAELLALWRPFT